MYFISYFGDEYRFSIWIFTRVSDSVHDTTVTINIRKVYTLGED
jgi:hypothetical protein